MTAPNEQAPEMTEERARNIVDHEGHHSGFDAWYKMEEYHEAKGYLARVEQEKLGDFHIGCEGEYAGVLGAVERVRAVLSGKDDGEGVLGGAELESLRRDLMTRLAGCAHDDPSWCDPNTCMVPRRKLDKVQRNFEIALDMLQSGDTWDAHERESLLAEIERRANGRDL